MAGLTRARNASGKTQCSKRTCMAEVALEICLVLGTAAAPWKLEVPSCIGVGRLHCAGNPASSQGYCSPATHPSAARQFFSTGSTWTTTHPARFSTPHSALSSLEHKPNANTQAKAEQSKSTTRLHPRDGLLPVDSKIGRPLVAEQSCWASINRGWRMPCLFSCSLLSPVSTALGMLTRITVLDCATGLQ